jgi:hypothetical protein
MGIILNAELPAGWSKEKGPDDNTIYHNSYTDDLTVDHPMSMFYRKTFAKVIKSNMDSTKEKIIGGLIVNEVSKMSINKLSKRKLSYENMCKGKKNNMKRRIVLGSSTAVEILNEDIDKLNKYKCEDGESLFTPDNRSSQRFIKINNIMKKTNMKPLKIHTDEDTFEDLRIRNCIKLLEKIFAENLSSVLGEPKQAKFIKDIIPD